MYFIGIDGSSSFTRLIGATETGKVLAKHAGGSIRLKDSSPEIVKITLTKLISEYNQLVGEKKDSCKAVTIGISRSEDREKYIEVCDSIGIEIPIYIVNELELYLAAATRSNVGIVLQSHKTSLGFCKNAKEKISYTGGFGHILDDGGSAFWIGMKAIRMALMTLDSRRKPTILTDKILEHFKIDNITEVIEYVHGEKFNKNLICDLAPIVREASQHKDQAAIEIEDGAAYELFLLTKGLIVKNKLNKCNVVACGSVLSDNASILAKTKALLSSNYIGAKITLCTEKPELGGVYLAEEFFKKEQ